MASFLHNYYVIERFFFIILSILDSVIHSSLGEVFMCLCCHIHIYFPLKTSECIFTWFISNPPSKTQQFCHLHSMRQKLDKWFFEMLKKLLYLCFSQAEDIRHISSFFIRISFLVTDIYLTLKKIAKIVK